MDCLSSTKDAFIVMDSIEQLAWSQARVVEWFWQHLQSKVVNFNL